MQTNTRKDYKSERNKKIYEEYINTKTSYNELAKKYDLTPQRIQIIVRDAKEKGIGEKLETKASQKKRETFKNSAVEQREKGNFDLSIDMLEQVIEWDLANKNFVGLADTYGHMAIIKQKQAKDVTKNASKIAYYFEAENYLSEALKLSKSRKVTADSGRVTTVHIAKNKYLKAKTLTGKKKQTELNSALKLINSAIKNFPGSDAHKAWPLSVKCQILNEAKKYDESFATAQEAESYIYKGYFKELDNKPSKKRKTIKNDQAEMKLNIWLAKTHLNMAKACVEEEKYLMAKQYATSVASIKDKDGTLRETKKDAKEVLEKVK